jgi:tetratricopeptide (TPR) repeat protein
VVIILLGLARAGVEGYAAYQLRAADKYLARQNYAAAKPHLEAALRVRPKTAVLHLRLGRLCRQLGKFDQAQEHLTACRRLEGESEEYQLEMLMLQAQAGQYDKVFDKLWVYVDQDRPESSLVLEALAVGHIMLDLYPPALFLIDRWLAREPKNVQALYLKGTCLVMQGIDSAAAVEVLEKALALDPERDDARQTYALALGDNQRYAESAEQHERFLKGHPGDPVSVVGLARARANLGEMEQARQLLDSLGDEGKKNSHVLAERGRLAMTMDQPKEAEGLLRAALALDPANATANYQLELCLVHLDRTAEAKALAEANRRRENDLTRIDTILHKEMQHNAGPDIYIELGRLLLRNGRDQGVQWLYKALEGNPNLREPHELLAKYWEEHDNPDQAKLHRAQLRALDARAEK